MYGGISSRISNKTHLILMMAVYFSSSVHLFMKEFDISKVATSRCASTSMIHLSRTDSVVTFGELASYLDIKYLYLLPPTTVLTFRVLSLFSLGLIWESSIMLLYYLVNSFLCIGMNVSLVWIYFISEWTYHIPFLPHFFRSILIESLFGITAVTSVLLWTAPWLNNT